MRNFTAIIVESILDTIEIDKKTDYVLGEDLIAVILIEDHLTPNEAIELKDIKDVMDNTPGGESLLVTVKTLVYSDGSASGDKNKALEELEYIHANITDLLKRGIVSLISQDYVLLTVQFDLTPIEAQ